MILKRAISNLKIQKRAYVIKKNDGISEEILDSMRKIDDKSGLPGYLCSGYYNVEQIVGVNDFVSNDIVVALGKDWYVLSCEGKDYIKVLNIVPSRNGEEERIEEEIRSYVSTYIERKARKEKKGISFSAFGDTPFCEIMCDIFLYNDHFTSSRSSYIDSITGQGCVRVCAFPVRKNIVKNLIKKFPKKGKKQEELDDLPF